MSGQKETTKVQPKAEIRDPKEIRMLRIRKMSLLGVLRISDFGLRISLRRLRLGRRRLLDFGLEAPSHETLALIRQRQKNLSRNPRIDSLAENHFQGVTAGEILFAILLLVIFPSQDHLWKWGRTFRADLHGFAAQFLPLLGEQDHGDTQVRRP